MLVSSPTVGELTVTDKQKQHYRRTKKIKIRLFIISSESRLIDPDYHPKTWSDSPGQSISKLER